MTATATLTDLKATIADDLARPDLATQIAAAITEAITHYATTRFYFNETRTTTFDTVAAQSTYDVDDDANIPLWLEIDQMYVTDSGGSVFPLGQQSDIVDLQWLLGNGAASGRPHSWAYYDQSFVFYPIPDDVYTITPIGHIEIAEPASDSEASNKWMTEAYELIRCRAKAYLFAHVIHQAEEAGLAQQAEQQALDRLLSKTARKTGVGRIYSSEF